MLARVVSKWLLFGTTLPGPPSSSNRIRSLARPWERIVSDTTPASIAWDFVHAFGFGARGEVWYGTVGNGWGVSTDGGRTWRNWTFRQLGPEWQYVAPAGIATRGDTVWIATADGLQVSPDAGATWIAFGDATGPAAKGPAVSSVVTVRLPLSRVVVIDRCTGLSAQLRGE